MVARNPQRTKTFDVHYYNYAVYELQMSQNDTVTLAEFISTANLSKAVLINRATAAEVTNTVANNVVTMTGAGTDLNLVLFVFGVAAT